MSCVVNVWSCAQIYKITDPVNTRGLLDFRVDKLLLVLVVLKQVKRLLFCAVNTFKSQL